MDYFEIAKVTGLLSDERYVDMLRYMSKALRSEGDLRKRYSLSNSEATRHLGKLMAVMAVKIYDATGVRLYYSDPIFMEKYEDIAIKLGL